mmetsp:Transcript_141161/g.260120  ORF Transcript_141161/g.260120 Transcript_141161/m.260120 type:complete len:121 (-) Transcript_141161:33-395(-)
MIGAFATLGPSGGFTLAFHTVPICFFRRTVAGVFVHGTPEIFVIFRPMANAFVLLRNPTETDTIFVLAGAFAISMQITLKLETTIVIHGETIRGDADSSGSSRQSEQYDINPTASHADCR